MRNRIEEIKAKGFNMNGLNREASMSATYQGLPAIDFNKINEDIYFLQGQLNYDINIFEVVDADDITLSDGWHDIIFNSKYRKRELYYEW